MEFICKECGSSQSCNSFEDVIKAEKLCKNCLYEKKREQRREKRTFVFVCPICEDEYKSLGTCSYITEEITPTKLTCSPECAQKREQEKKEAQKAAAKIHRAKCEYCLGIFDQKGKEKYCSDECRKKGREKSKFYKDLKLANDAVALSKVRVYGANADLAKGFVNEKSRKNIDDK